MRAMARQHPIDKGVRDYLRNAGLNETEFARAIGWNQATFHRWINGEGHATIDDIVRMVAQVIGANPKPMTGLELRLVRALSKVPEEIQEDAVAVFERHEKMLRHSRAQQSTEPEAHNSPAKASRGREKR
jgi:plasmid maintenance system antidote protein VapI